MAISVCNPWAHCRGTSDERSDFNLDFYTEVQDLSYLENVLNTTSPRFTALNMALISVIEDYSLVGFETLAVEVSNSPHMRLSGCATGPLT